MENRYARNMPALSEAECGLLGAKTVAVIGCGGLGGYLIEYLARIGTGSIRVVDADVFEESNLNRQLLSGTASLGKSKAEVAAARVRAINPDVRVEAYAVFLDASNARSLLSGCDAVLDALDNISARRILSKACEAENIPCIHGAIDRWVAQAAISMPGDQLIEKLYSHDSAPLEPSVLSFTPALCACLQASLCVRLLTGRNPETGKLHYFDLLHEEYEQIPIK